MALIICPECGNQCAADAVACPQCGHPFAPPRVQAIPEPVVVREIPRERPFPNWIFIPIAIIIGVVIFAVVVMMRGNDDEANRNIKVNVATRDSERTGNTKTTTITGQPSEVTTVRTPDVVTLPPATSSAPPLPPPTTTESRTVTADSVPVGKSALSIEAKVRDKNSGNPQTVSKEKFYLLDKDLESILSDAGIEDTEGQGLVNAFGMSVVNPQQYGDTNRKALAAIKKHIIAETLTDAQGKAKFAAVKPDSYYLFGIHKTADGFAVWNNPITLNEGANQMTLDPR